MYKPIYPTSSRDRFFFWASIALIIIAIGLAFLENYWLAILSVVVAIYEFWVSYSLRDPEKSSESSSDEYEKVISQIAAMVAQLNELNQFFSHEQQRIKDAEETIQKLNNERSELEPLVQTQKATVEAILSAHADRTAKFAWKERLIGFGSGIFTSILASIIYEFFTR